MLVRASSTARVIDLHCATGNPRVSVRRSTAPRTTDSHLGWLYRASINNRPPRYPGVRSWSLLDSGRRKVFICDMRGLLGEVVGSSEISAKEPDLAVYILLQERRSVRPRKLTMDCDGRGAGDGCYLSGALAAGLEAPNRTMKNYQVRDICCVAVAVAIHLRESAFLKLANQVFIECNLEFSRQLDFVRLNHFDLN